MYSSFQDIKQNSNAKVTDLDVVIQEKAASCRFEPIAKILERCEKTTLMASLQAA